MKARPAIVNKDGRVRRSISGDDERFDYVYKFVTAGTFEPERPRRQHGPARRRHALRRAGSTTTARSTGCRWSHGQGPLTAANGFASQADVLIETRRAADLLGATKMDRPEDIEPNPSNGKVYVMLTNNTQRKADAGRRRQPARRQRLRPHHRDRRDGGDHRRDQVRVGSAAEMRRSRRSPRSAPPSRPPRPRTAGSACPDNCAVDALGRLWVATDGKSPARTGRTDGLWAVDTEGAARAA